MKNIDIKIIRQWSKMGPRAMFGQFMLDLAKKDKKLMILSADLGRSSGLDRFKKEFPNQYLSVGISEQNMIGVASGLAKEGFKVFVTSFAPFLSMRASEQIRMNLGYMKLPVNLVALGSGVSMGYLGNSHFGLEDIGVMRTIPGLNISCPADCLEMRKMLFDYAQNNRGPSYIRLTGTPGYPPTYHKDYNYKIGLPVKLIDGNEVLIIATGSMVSQAILAEKILKKKDISVKLLNLNTLKPVSKKLKNELKKFKMIFTIEEHSILGGLGTIVAEEIVNQGIKTNLEKISLPDKFGPTGNYNYLLNYHGLTGEKSAKKILRSMRF